MRQTWFHERFCTDRLIDGVLQATMNHLISGLRVVQNGSLRLRTCPFCHLALTPNVHVRREIRAANDDWVADILPRVRRCDSSSTCLVLCGMHTHTGPAIGGRLSSLRQQSKCDKRLLSSRFTSYNDERRRTLYHREKCLLQPLAAK